MLHWCDGLFWLMCALMRNIVTKRLRQLSAVVCENLRVPLSPRLEAVRANSWKRPLRVGAMIHTQSPKPQD
jgi:hypothetical protein